jgi:hypothetical protein
MRKPMRVKQGNDKRTAIGVASIQRMTLNTKVIVNALSVDPPWSKPLIKTKHFSRRNFSKIN